MPKIEAVIWDMDGVLIDSEPFWQQGETIAFAAVGLQLQQHQLTETMGLRIDAAVQYWYDRHPWEMPPTTQTVADQITQHVIDAIGREGVAKAGVMQTLAFFRDHGLRMAIASSSYMRLIEAVVARLGIADFFEVIHSAEFETYGKPHPGVYISTAQKLNVSPHNCLVIEDSIRGIISAKAAEMHCVAVPDPTVRHDPRLSLADTVLPSLAAFDTTFWKEFEIK